MPSATTQAPAALRRMARLIATSIAAMAVVPIALLARAPGQATYAACAAG